ncbi:MAG: hypothetical protein ACYC36_06070 [Bellilinea sp.]
MAGLPKGRTNNPNGRPPKNRALTDALALALKHTVDFPDGRKVSGKKVLANLVTSVLTTGRIKFPNDTEESIVSVKDWMEFAKWAYGYLEPAATRLEHTGEDGNILEILVRYADRTDTTEAT